MSDSNETVTQFLLRMENETGSAFADKCRGLISRNPQMDFLTVQQLATDEVDEEIGQSGLLHRVGLQRCNSNRV